MPIIVSLSGEYAVDCSQVNKHGIPKNRGKYRHFNAKQNQWQYWSKLSFAAKTKILAEHTNEGMCVLCKIDEKLSKM